MGKQDRRIKYGFPYVSISFYVTIFTYVVGWHRRKYMTGILSYLCFLEWCCLFIFKACSGLDGKCSLTELSAPHLLSYKRNRPTLYYLQVSLSSHMSWIHQNFVFVGHWHHYTQAGWQGRSADVPFGCISSVLSSHCPIRLHWQNTGAKLKSLVTPRQKQQSFKSRVRPFSVYLPSLHTHKVTSVYTLLLFSGTTLTQEWMVGGAEEMKQPDPRFRWSHVKSFK